MDCGVVRAAEVGECEEGGLEDCPAQCPLSEPRPRTTAPADAMVQTDTHPPHAAAAVSLNQSKEARRDDANMHSNLSCHVELLSAGV
uniref:Uncharacterized protein n=1 Tax=Knipowitschia caucasica TaxID=637954 RepID=A0AAV2JL52_KNICA